MTYTTKKNIKSGILAIITIIVCAHFSNPHSKQGRDKPEINFYGSLVYADGQEVDVENITIGNAVRDIVVYHEPPASAFTKKKNEKGFDIEINRTRLSLDKICRIRTLNPLIVYRNRNYVKIEVLSNDQEQVHNVFLIEQRKEISCSLKKSGFEKEVSFSALKDLKIFGRRSQQYHDGKERDQRYCTFDKKEANQGTMVTEEGSAQESMIESRADSIQEDQNLILTKTAALIQDLEAKAKELPAGSITDTIQNLLYELKSSIARLF